MGENELPPIRDMGPPLMMMGAACPKPPGESPPRDPGAMNVLYVPEHATVFQLIDGRWELLYEPKSVPEGK